MSHKVVRLTPYSNRGELLCMKQLVQCVNFLFEVHQEGSTLNYNEYGISQIQQTMLKQIHSYN